MVAKNTVFRLVACGGCGMYRYIVPFSVSANHSRALFGVVNSNHRPRQGSRLLDKDREYIVGTGTREKILLQKLLSLRVKSVITNILC